MKIVFASNNTGKIRELNEFLKDQQIDLIPQNALAVNEIEETAVTFVENALLKARHASRLTGLPALSDDSGLSVPYLHGSPGIYSARYAGKKSSAEDNIKKLLTQLEGVPDENRHAFFYCVLVFLQHDEDPAPLICAGKWPGIILHEPMGGNGFGYDPIFYIPELKKTAAELPLTLKNKISHRGIALQALLKLLSEK